MCIDVTIVSSLTNSRVTEPLGAPVILAATKKIEKNKEACRLSGMDFMPFAMDTTGLIEREAAELLERLAYQYAERQSKSYAEAISILRRRISFAVQLGVARQLVSAKSDVKEDDAFFTTYCSVEE
jgi:hypothetical protein